MDKHDVENHMMVSVWSAAARVCSGSQQEREEAGVREMKAIDEQ